MIQVENVSVTYGSKQGRGGTAALHEVSLHIKPGEFFTLIGPSGCGKSTLLNVIAGLQSPTSGRVTIAGQTVTGPLPDTTSVVFQEHCLFPWRTVQDNVELGLEFAGVPKSVRRGMSARYLEMVGLSDFASHLPQQLSGGMKQRAALARALCMEPKVLLLDEPFGALDEQTRLILGEEVSRIFAEVKRTTVLVTHSLSEAVFLSDRIAVLTPRPGRIKAIVEVPFPQPRTVDFMASSEFHELRNHLFELLRDEMREAVLGRPPLDNQPPSALERRKP